MTVTPGFNKQISYPDFLTRLLAISIDVPLAAFLTSPLTQYMTLIIFQYVFSDFLESHNFVITSQKDLSLVIMSDDFPGYVNFYNFGTFALGATFVQFIIISFYFVISWTIFGTTLGKFFLKMKIVNFKTLQKPSLISSILRYLFYILGPINIFYLFFNKQKRAIHDYVAETIVIKS